MPNDSPDSPTTAVCYLRISKDDAGTRLGVDRQEKACRKLAAERGLEIAEVITDNDLSAFRARTRRPGFERLVELLKAGKAEAVVAYHADRLYRRARDLESVIELVEATGVQIHTVASGEIDLSTASGRMTARIVGAVAQQESERISERTKMKNEERATKGSPPGGRAPYGYAWQTQLDREGKATRCYVVEPSEAAVLRKMATGVLEGKSLLGVARELEAAGIKTRSNTPWHHSAIRAVLTNPAVAGLRVRSSEVGGKRRRESEGPGNWQPILDRATFELLKATVADERRKRTRPAKRYLLAGLVRSTGGARMDGAPDQAGRPSYITRWTREGRARPWVSIEAAKLEEFVIEAVLERLDQTSLPAPEPVDPSEIEELEADLVELARQRGEGVISLAEWSAARTPLLRRLEEARRALPRQGFEVTKSLLSEPGVVRQIWPELELADRHAIVAELVAAVVVGPAPRARHTPVSERAEITWKP